MLSVHNVSLQFGKRVLFDEVNISFSGDNCYGVIGANGAGKSTLLKILSGDKDPNTGNVSLEAGKRMAVLKQEHFEFDEVTVMDTVLQGHKVLWDIMVAKNELYAKEDFSDEDGIKASELETEFAEMDGWSAEPEAASLLSGIGIHEDFHMKHMKELDGNQKVRVLLAQALFGDPDVLILDEPTNDLDLKTITWLEDFLLDFKNTVIVVSHDRHFLDTVCTHIVDIDFAKVNAYTGNYSFWYQSSQLALKQRQNQNKKTEDKRQEMQAFIDRFSANASKSRQATSRKKMLDKLVLDDIKPSSRKYPGIIFRAERSVGKQLLGVKGLSAQAEDGTPLFTNLSFEMNQEDKIAIISNNSLATTAFYEVLNDHRKASEGFFEFGQTITTAYLPNDNESHFTNPVSLIDWLRQYSDNKDEAYIRGFLGQMLFTGEESLKMCDVLSGGEKVRCMLSKMIMAQANILMMDEPTNHLDLESITALNNAMLNFNESILFTSHDHEITSTVANRIIELGPKGFIDSLKPYDEYMSDPGIAEQRKEIY